MSLPPSLTLRYQLLGELGAGGMGQVLACRDTKLDRDVAIKLLRPDAIHPADRVRFEREARTLSALSLAGVVRIYDFGTVDDTPFLVMERLAGQSLAARLKGGQTLSETTVVRLWSSLLATLTGVHAAGIVHRDIKPSNIWLRSDTDPVLLDFGLARAIDTTHGLTTAGTLLGTLGYMAPELLNTGTADSGTDLWALALSMFECLVDVRVHSGHARSQEPLQIDCFNSVIHGTYHDHASRALAGRGALADLVLVCLSPRVDLRPGDARAVHRALKALGARPSRKARAAEPASVTRVLPPPGATRRRASAALAVLALALGALALSTRTRDPRGPGAPGANAGAGSARPADPRETPAAAPARAGAPSIGARAALVAFRPGRLAGELGRAVAARPRDGAALESFRATVRATWSARLDDEIAASGLAAAARAPGEDAPTLEERLEHYRLASDLWQLDGQCRDLGAPLPLDVRALFPRTHRPLASPPPLADAESIGIRWRLRVDPPLPLGARPTLVLPGRPGEKRFYTQEDHRSLLPEMLASPQEKRLEYIEETVLPWRRPLPGERLVMMLSARRLGLTGSLDLSFSTAGNQWSPVRVRFRGAGTELQELWHEIDPGLITGPTRVRLAFEHRPALFLSGDVYAYGLVLHYVLAPETRRGGP